jgi:hypothetical protein
MPWRCDVFFDELDARPRSREAWRVCGAYRHKRANQPARTPCASASGGVSYFRSPATSSACSSRSQLLRDPEGTAFTLRGGGFVSGFGMEELELAPSSSEWGDPDMPKRFTTKSGARGEISWSG